MDLLHAADSGRLSIVKELVSKDSSLIRNCRHVDAKNRAFNVDGTAIHYACRSGHSNVVKYLIKQDPSIINDLDCEAWTPLHYACYNGHLDIVKFLLESKADVTLRDSYLFQTPIQFAMYRLFEDIVYLLDPNAEWTRRNADEISTKGKASVFRKNSNLFLGRYSLNEDHIKQIQLFRNDPQYNDIELRKIQDNELSKLNVRLVLTHDFKKHISQTVSLTSDADDDSFLRSSSTSTNEHIMVFKDE
ncbi:unnamed protein product [Rotaria socialis]|uniref:Uncharacterized protein n=1 Tax=Rotaria socialis TaxID=392032 RepID=A0A818QPE7_9BILA|nr:unnamed protein product [Rotaria socialis]CAF4591380.1 unnamed protein product [Rotaria socialis]